MRTSYILRVVVIIIYKGFGAKKIARGGGGIVGAVTSTKTHSIIVFIYYILYTKKMVKINRIKTQPLLFIKLYLVH